MNVCNVPLFGITPYEMPLLSLFYTMSHSVFNKHAKKIQYIYMEYYLKGDVISKNRSLCLFLAFFFSC